MVQPMAQIGILLFLAKPLSVGPCQSWNVLEQKVQDGNITAQDARLGMESLHQLLLDTYALQTIPGPIVFPVKTDGRSDIGGEKGEGYQPWGYNFYQGNRHLGHPAQDIFIDDDNLDAISDSTGKPAQILSMFPGVVVAAQREWDPKNGSRGGKYVWVLNPQNDRYCYYAHLKEVMVQPGDVLRAGDVLGLMGRSGKNAYSRRSPTHLHLMCLDFNHGAMTPVNTYPELRFAYRQFDSADRNSYPWLERGARVLERIQGIPPPDGFARVEVPEGSFAKWLRNLPLRKKGTAVYLFNGKVKGNQQAHEAVVDIDVGSSDLQQCADALIRLRSEYLFSARRFEEIHYKFVNGFEARYTKWQMGQRIKVTNNNASWVGQGAVRYDHRDFRDFLNVVFTYANTFSLSQELEPVLPTEEPKIGDVFIQGGFPGHAVLVVDLAKDGQGRPIFLLAQSYMPAQDIHVLKSPDSIYPWYRADFGDELKTPEWTFNKIDRRRFRD